MKLSAYLEKHSIKRGEFAAQIGVSGGRVTQLCEENAWPSREVAERIASVTLGMVTADDFLRLDEGAEMRT